MKEAWAKLQGKWELLPHPDLRVTLEFHPGYTVSRESVLRKDRPIQTRRTVARIDDHTAVGVGGGVVPAGGKAYMIQYRPAGRTLTFETVGVRPDGLIVTTDGKFRRVSAGPDGRPPPTLEEAVLAQLVGGEWQGQEYIRFKPDKTVTVWKTDVGGGRAAIRLQGQVTGARMIGGGRFVVTLGKHKADGRDAPRGELGEFSFVGQFLHRKDKDGTTWVFENRTPRD